MGRRSRPAAFVASDGRSTRLVDDVISCVEALGVGVELNCVLLSASPADDLVFWDASIAAGETGDIYPKRICR